MVTLKMGSLLFEKKETKQNKHLSNYKVIPNAPPFFFFSVLIRSKLSIYFKKKKNVFAFFNSSSNFALRAFGLNEVHSYTRRKLKFNKLAV